MPSREYRDPNGVVWEVFEVRRLQDRPNSVRPALSAGWLAFMSDGEKRRLPQYPSDWMQLQDDELHELLEAAVDAPVTLRSATRADDGSPGPEREEAPRHVERRKRPRNTPPAVSAESAPALPASRPAVTLVSTPPVSGGGGLPVPDPPTVSGTLGSVGIEALVRAHARQARQDGTAVIQGMIGVKRALASAGEDISPETLRQLRKVFVDEFYFAR